MRESAFLPPTSPDCDRSLRRRGGRWCSRLMILLMLSPALAYGTDERGSYRDDVDAIEEHGIQELGKQIESLRQTLRRRSPAPDRTPGSSRKDERTMREYHDDVAPIDPKDLEELEALAQELEQRVRTLEQKKQRQKESAGAAGPPLPASRYDQLDDRITNIERLLVGTQDKPGLAGLIGGWTKRNGFFLESAHGGFFLRVSGFLQADYRSFPGGQNGSNPGIQPSTFVLQRARLNVYGRLFHYFRFLITPDLGNGFTNSPLVNGRVQIFNGFIEWDQLAWMAVRVGKFKNPIGLEMLQAPQHLAFMERSLVRNLLPNRDIGAMLSGQLLRGGLEYQLGVFNGAPNANFAEESRAFSSGKALTARLFTSPFLHRGPEWIQRVGVGAGMSYGSIRNTTGQDPMQTETFSYTFFQYRNTVSGDGDQIRVSPQMYWYWKRWGFLSQYIWTSQRERLFNGPSAALVHRAWSAQLSMFLTEDTATFGRVDPRRPFDLTKPGSWGAWEVAARFAEINLDPTTFALGMADPTFNAERARSTTVGLNWYLNYNVRMTANFVHTDFKGSGSSYHAASHEDALMIRVQLVY
jgi:phosphate-selective porin OprO and OprP